MDLLVTLLPYFCDIGSKQSAQGWPSAASLRATEETYELVIQMHYTLTNCCRSLTTTLTDPHITPNKFSSLGDRCCDRNIELSEKLW